MAVPLARRNLLHEKGKFLLSVAGVAAALALILLLLGFREGLYVTVTAYVDNIGADLIVAQSGVQGMFSSDSSLPLNIHEKMTGAAAAEEAGHILIADIILTRDGMKTPVLLVGYDPATTFGDPWRISQGRGVAADDEIVLDSWLAKRIDVAVGEAIDMLGHRFTVVGLTQETASWMSPYVFISLEAAQSSLGLTNMVSYHLLRLPENVSAGAATQAVETVVSGVDVLTPEAIAKADRRVLATIMDRPLKVMLFIGVVIGAAVMGLTAYTAVTDQVRDYGVLKAIGAGSRRLTLLVTTETFYRAILGYGLGAGLAYVAAALIMTIWPQFNIVITRQTVLQAGALALVMTLAAALLPIRRLSRIDPMLVFKA